MDQGASVTPPSGAGSDTRGVVDLVRTPVHRDKARSLFDALEPGADRREGRELEIAEFSDMGVAVEGDVGDSELVRGEKIMRLEMIFHHLQRRIAAFHPIFQRMR